MNSDRYGAALSCLRRYRTGWTARRNGLGFLMWTRANVWEGMSEVEAEVVLDSDPYAPHTPQGTAS